MREAIFTALVYVIQAVIIVLGTFLIAFVKQKLELVKQRIGQERYLLLSEVAQNVVKAVEQMIGAGNGELKKSEAIAFLTKHFGISEAEAEQLIESAVFELNKVLKNNTTMQQ